MSDDVIKERVRERLAAAELSSVLGVAVGDVDDGEGKPQWAWWLVAATLLLGLGVAVGSAWLRSGVDKLTAQDRGFIDVLHPWHHQLLPRGAFHRVDAPADLESLPDGLDEFAVSLTDGGDLLQSLLQKVPVRRLALVSAVQPALSRRVYQELARAPHLEYLWLADATLRADHLRELRLAPRLMALALLDTRRERPDLLQVDRAVGQSIAELPRLKSLVFWRVDVRPQGLEALASLPHLETLVVDDGRMHEQMVEAIAGLKTLRVLGLSWHNAQLTGTMLEALATLPRLQVLDVSLAVNDTMLARMPVDLESLTLSRIGEVTADGLRSLQRLKHLRSLGFRQRTQKGHQGALADLISRLPIENYDCSVEVPSSVVWQALQASTTLRRLHMRRQGNGDLQSCLGECAKVARLEYLELGCRTLPTPVELAVLKDLTQLREVVLDPMNPTGVTKAQIEALDAALGDAVTVKVRRAR